MSAATSHCLHDGDEDYDDDAGDGGDDDRFSWNIRPFASNLPNQPIINQQPFNYNWPAVPTSTLG